MAGIDLSLSGLASGFDWKSFVDQMVQVERAVVPFAGHGTEKAELGTFPSHLNVFSGEKQHHRVSHHRRLN